VAAWPELRRLAIFSNHKLDAEQAIVIAILTAKRRSGAAASSHVM
jgi:hypothetical protein